jgi:hypothetical protein
MKKLLILILLISLKASAQNTVWNQPAFTGNMAGVRFLVGIGATSTRHVTFEALTGAFDLRYLQSYTETDPVWSGVSANYSTTAEADALYSPLGHSHTFASLTSKPTTISGYGITDAFTQTAADGLYSPLGHTHTFASLTSRPTTLSGYGITDAQAALSGTGFVKISGTTISYDNSTYSLSGHTHAESDVINLISDLSGKQATLVSGTNIKTINSTSILGSGDIATGTVTTASVVSANGFAGTVATATSTPAITLTTSVTGMLKGNGTAISAGTAGTDYVSPGTATTYTAGAKQTFGASSTTAGFNVGAVSGDPSSLATGDVWYNQNNKQFRYYAASTIRVVPLAGVASTTAASAAINTTETILTTHTIKANSMTAGQTYRVTCLGTCTSTAANASNIRVRVGTAGTTADAVVAVITPTAATSGTSIPFQATFYVTIRTTAAGTGTCVGMGSLNNNGVTGISAAADVVSAATTVATLNDSVDNIISLSYVSAATTTTSTFQIALIEVVKM